MQQRSKFLASTLLIIVFLVTALLSTAPQKSYAQIDVETPSVTAELPTETSTPETTVTSVVSETPIPSATLPATVTETVVPTSSETPVPTETVEIPEGTLTPFQWSLSVDVDPKVNGAITISEIGGLPVNVQENQLSVSGNASDQLNSFLFDSASSSFDFLGGPDQLTLTIPANGSIITLNLEDRITTGYEWEVLPGENYSQVGKSTFLSRYDATGAPAIQTIKIQTAKQGTAVVNLIYRRSFEKDRVIHARLKIQASSPLEKFDLYDPTPAQISQESGDENGSVNSTSIEPSVTLPSSLDWRTSGITTPVKDQGGCGSCWAFSTVAVMESAILKAGGPSTNLSEQFLVSCNTKGNSCAGGAYDTHYWHYDTLGYNQSKIGAVLESDMPYTESDGTCYAVANHPYRLSGWSFVTAGNLTVPTTEQLKTAIYNYGPIKVSICAGSAFQAYSGGVFSTNENVCGGGTNHAVVLVGWNDSTSSWILRNSWGPNWGENGYMRIRYGTSVVGRNASWVTYAVIPAAPRPSAPSGYITDTTPTFTWPVVANAASYTLTVTDKTTSTTAFTTTVKSTACTSSTCSYTPTTPLTINHSYQWRMKATNSSGTSGAYSNYLSFSLTVPAAPVLKSPLNTIDDATPTFTWAVSKTATAYNLVVSDSTTGGTVINVKVSSSSCTTTTCSYTYPTALTIGKTFIWKVSASNLLGRSAYSSLSFTIAKPSAPVTVSPVSITGSSKQVFTWQVTPSATSYTVALYNTVTSSYVFTQTVTSSACNTSTCSYTSPTAIVANNTYKWRVVAKNALGSGPYSAFVYFQLKVPAVPVTADPQGDIWTNLPTFNWSAVNGAKSYTLAVYNTETALFEFKSTVSLTYCDSANCSYTPTVSLDVDTAYQWMVHANNDAGYGAYSAPTDFVIRVPDVPTPKAPVSIIDNYTPNFTWAPVDHATSYTVLLYNATAKTYVFSNTINSSICSETLCSYTSPSVLIKGVNYTWQLSANDAAGSSALSSSLSFNISAPGVPFFLSPSGTIYEQIPTFSWRKSEGADYYRLHVYDNTGTTLRGDTEITPTCNDATCTWNGVWVPLNHSISWYITAVNGVGESMASDVFIVKVK